MERGHLGEWERVQRHKSKTYIDDLDGEVFPFVSHPDWVERYPTTTVREMPSSFYEELRLAGEQLFAIFNKTSLVLQKSPDELLVMLGLPVEVIPFLRMSNPLRYCSFLSRMDFLYDEKGGLKFIEINSDTPCAVIESFYGNRIACDYYDKDDPNEMFYKDISKVFHTILQSYEDCGYVTTNFVFTSNDQFNEDLATTLYLMNLSGFKAKYVPLADLRVKREGLFANGEKIDVLYRLHPIEMMAKDTDVDGYPSGLLLLELVRQKKLVMINPPEGLILQTKALQALIWSLKNDDTFYSQTEKNFINQYMLPSFLDQNALIGEKHIEKPILGREGNGITLYDEKKEVLECTKDEVKLLGSSLYQKFFETPDVECGTSGGMKQGKLTYSVFVLNGQATSVFCRFNTSLIAGLNAYWLPLSIKKDSLG